MIPQVQKMLRDLGVRQFIGPPVYKCGGDSYISLCTAGIQREGRSDGIPALTEEDAISYYCDTLQRFLLGQLASREMIEDGFVPKPCKVIIWRETPNLVVNEEVFVGGKTRKKFQIYSRLLAYPEEWFKELL